MSEHTDGHLIHWAWAYDAMVQVMSLGRARAFRQKTLGLAQLRPGQRMLDVGCGTGSLALEAARQQASAEIHGIDPAPEMIHRARAKATAAGVTIDFEQAVIERLPFDDASFDVVTSSIMLHHLPAETLHAGLAEVTRVLVPGGRLVVVDFAGAGPLMHRLGALLHGDGGHPTRHLDVVLEAVRAQGFDEPMVHAMKPGYLFGLVTQRAG